MQNSRIRPANLRFASPVCRLRQTGLEIKIQLGNATDRPVAILVLLPMRLQQVANLTDSPGT